MDFWNLTAWPQLCISSNKALLLILTKHFHELGMKNSNIRAYGGHSHFNYHIFLLKCLKKLHIYRFGYSNFPCILHFFLSVGVTIWRSFLIPIQLSLHSFPLLLSSVLYFYILQSQQYNCLSAFTNWFLNWLREEMGRNGQLSRLVIACIIMHLRDLCTRWIWVTNWHKLLSIWRPFLSIQ